MKISFFPLLALPFCSLPAAHSQSCFPEGLVFSSQIDLNNFKVQNPTCKIIEGDVIIVDSDISNLLGLGNITEIKGTLFIQNNPLLAAVNGLNKLTSVGGFLDIESNAALTNLGSLNKLTSIGTGLFIQDNNALTNLNGLNGLTTIGGDLYIHYSPALTNLNGLDHLTTVGGEIFLNVNQSLTSLSGLSSLTSVGGGIDIWYQGGLTDLTGLQNITSPLDSLQIYANAGLTSLNGLPSNASIGGDVIVYANASLTSLGALAGLTDIGGDLTIARNNQIINLNGLNNLTTVGGNLRIGEDNSLTSLSALANLQSIGGDLIIDQNYPLFALNGLTGLTSIGRNLRLRENTSLASLSGLSHLTSLGGNLDIRANPSLSSLHGLEGLPAVGDSVLVTQNQLLTDLNGLSQVAGIGGTVLLAQNSQVSGLDGLEQLTTIGGGLYLHEMTALTGLGALQALGSIGGNLVVTGNPQLTTLNGLAQLSGIGGGIEITNNPVLATCSIPPVCQHVYGDPASLNIGGNAPGCNTVNEVEKNCGAPLLVAVRIDADGDCQPDAANPPVPEAGVWVSGLGQNILQPTAAAGLVHFRYFNNGPATLSLAQFPTANWDVCAPSLTFEPGISPDTTVFLLRPLNACPELRVALGLPSVFTDCATATVAVSVRNSGTTSAQGVQVAVVMPAEMQLLGAVPPSASQSGDTLFFTVNDILPLNTASVQLTVKTGCTGTLPERTLCWSAFAQAGNACPVNPSPHSDIRVSAECTGAQVRFILKNTGDAATQNPHAYTLIRNTLAGESVPFSLAAQANLTVELPADGATYRLEATRLDDGQLTAAALEGCGGLTPGLITAFWLEKGPVEADFDCRQVTGQPQQAAKSAIPAGVGTDHLLAPDRPLLYILAFHNSETAPIHSVALTDVLPPELLVNTFQPVAASHPYTWQIREGNILEVRFDTLLPADAHGFFTFSIEQQAGLPEETVIVNTASVLFDTIIPAGNGATTHTISTTGAESQQCLPQGIVFYSQEQVDHFALDYPGCGIVQGNVEIAWNEIHDLQGLSVLKTVQGSLWIHNTGSLGSLQGLHHLTRIGQDLSIEAANALTDLSGLDALRTIDSNLVINSNQALTSLHGLDSLYQLHRSITIEYNSVLADISALGRLPHAIGTDLALYGNDQLLSLQGLHQIDTVRRELHLEYNGLPNLNDLQNLRYVGGNFSISGGNALTSLAGLTGLEAIGNSFSLYYIPNIIELGGPPNLRTIGGNLGVAGLHQLENFHGLPQLDSVGGDLVVYDNPSQTTLNGLTNLRSTGGINLSGTAMQHLQGLDSLTTLRGNLSLSGMPTLLDCKGADRLRTIGGRMEIFGNPVLKNFTGLDRLRTIGDSLTVDNNPALLHFTGLAGLQAVGNDLSVTNCQSLVDFTGLDSLRTIGDSLFLYNNAALQSLHGLTRLDTIGDALRLLYNLSLHSLEGLDSLRYIGGELNLASNPQLTGMTGLGNLNRIGGNFSAGAYDVNSSSITSFQGLNQLAYIGGNLQVPEYLTGFNGLENLTYLGGNLHVYHSLLLPNFNGLTRLKTIGGNFTTSFLLGLTSFDGLDSLTTIGGYFGTNQLSSVTSIGGLKNLATVGGTFGVEGTGITSLAGLDHLTTIGGNFTFPYTLPNFQGVPKLKTIGGSFTPTGQLYLRDFSGLESLTSIGGFFGIFYNQELESFHGLENLTTIGGPFRIQDNPKLASLDGLRNVTSIGGDYIYVFQNPQLSECAVYAICNAIFLNDPNVTLSLGNNGPGCATFPEFAAACNTIPVRATVRIDQNGDCLPDSTDTPLAGIQVQLSGSGAQMTLRPTGADGVATFGYFKNGPFDLYLPQFPTASWGVCQDNFQFSLGVETDSVEATFLLTPLQMQCAQLTVELGLPGEFRSCLATSEMAVAVKNTGSLLAENVVVAVVKPAEIDLVTATPLPASQVGDTLYFEVGDVQPLTTATVRMTVRTNCAFFLFTRTLCFEAFAKTLIPCQEVPLPASEIRVSAQCVNDSLVRFTLQNVGEEATQTPHQYVLYRNTTPVDTMDFSLGAHESLTVDLASLGATCRMEATKSDDGRLTAAALENCGGFTAGLINAFWLEKGPLEYDFDCRQVTGSFDPNQKTAVPTGTGDERFLAPNRPLTYTIDFQNTGTDTAFRVQLIDVLDADLDAGSFRPGFASHPYTWQIRGLDTLEVLFLPIMLPDSNVNEPASHGFFTFQIAQQPDLGDGATLENTANIIFDFNPAIVTNTVRHTIGRLTVEVDEAQAEPYRWMVWGNPLREATTFRSAGLIAGEKRFDLYATGGRLARSARFSGQTFEFQRDGLPAGLYYFKITTADGRVFGGKMVVVE